MTNYILQGIGKNEGSAESRLEKLIDKANQKLVANNLPSLYDPINQEYSIETRVDEQRRFVGSDFDGAIAQAEETLGDYKIISYCIINTYDVTKEQLNTLQSDGANKEKKSPTAGLDLDKRGESKDISSYLRIQ